MAPAPTLVPDSLHDIDLMERDSKRIPDTGSWEYAKFPDARAMSTGSVVAVIAMGRPIPSSNGYPFSEVV